MKSEQPSEREILGSEDKRSIAVIGLGHIGLPTALLLAQDNEVVGVDVDETTVSTLESGELPFEEPGMRELFASVREQFTAQTTLPETADTYLVAVPTPLDEVTEVADLTHVRAAMETIADALSPGDMVVLESTVPPGTTEHLIQPILEESPVGPDGFDYAYCPERAIPGDTLDEMRNNDRVIGGLDDESRERVRQLYCFVTGEIYTTDPTTAEFVKLIENTYRDVNIALANELGKLAEQYSIDGREAIAMANKHPRVDILSPGPGVGGHCLPIDPQFLSQASTDSRLISLAREINDLMPVHVLRLIRELVGERTKATVTVLGVAYKGDVEDTRETPALRLLRLAENEGYDVRVHDPYVRSFEYELEELDTAVKDSDCLTVVTDHSSFADLNPETLASQMRTPTVIDTHDLLDLDDWEAAGFETRRLADGK